jgi:N-acetylglucosamine-6-sulfatase
VPLVIRADALTGAPATDDHLALNIDLAATIADFAGVVAPHTDGRSLVPLLTDGGARWRHRFLIEHVQTSADRNDPPTYCAVRTTGWKFVRYADGVEELYDLRADPWELENLAGRPGSVRATARARDVLRRMCLPRPPGLPPF